MTARPSAPLHLRCREKRGNLHDAVSGCFAVGVCILGFGGFRLDILPNRKFADSLLALLDRIAESFPTCESVYVFWQLNLLLNFVTVLIKIHHLDILPSTFKQSLFKKVACFIQSNSCVCHFFNLLALRRQPFVCAYYTSGEQKSQ